MNEVVEMSLKFTLLGYCINHVSLFYPQELSLKPSWNQDILSMTLQIYQFSNSRYKENGVSLVWLTVKNPIRSLSDHCLLDFIPFISFFLFFYFNFSVIHNPLTYGCKTPVCWDLLRLSWRSGHNWLEPSFCVLSSIMFSPRFL